ncbi:hypothetical protein Q765_11390 [Flavobacterium rivuli WB 3.3-2 = DSM 21788]|uniref:Secretion system C-terminal sorting domain-containing protein n=1 Tax=Flavobacterium rivuli WB 3.3-2 = DSM 21788 TaxID=1121895 RepID=A0A0A2M1F2_9FLAO|nr:T9SS type A sorting domain-containing protein [Flavobacterium rivuli]KGO86472.1 hypothetical protein Q765_11390 [Flavobacterium rivuli WB 3.3-2 = DSM 21788]
MKTKLLTLGFFALTAFIPACVHAQNTYINDFEEGSPVVTATYGAEFAIVPNPVAVGNASANSGQIKRTSGAWYEIVRFATSFNVPANTSKYVHLRAMYTSSVIPNMSVRIDAAADNDGSADVHPTMDYTTPGAWQDMVFRIDGGETGVNPSQFLFFADASVNVLNNTDSFAYIDEIVLNDSETPFDLTAGTNAFAHNTVVKTYPNPTTNLWNFEAAHGQNLTGVQIIDALGKIVFTKNVTSDKLSVDASSFSNGLYFAKITSGTAIQTIRVIKN